jgi:dihydrofolate reductase
MSVDGLIATTNRVADEDSEWSDSAFAGWCGYCTAANNVIVGRKTYDELAEMDLSDLLFPEHRVVVSSRNLEPADQWMQFSTPGQAVAHLESRGVEDIIVGGGHDLALACLTQGLIDEIVLDIQPILFGYGTPLLGESERSIELELIDSARLDQDAIRLHYKIRGR